eukprot:466166-Pleurochrysis_carterae.AAC.2
MLLDEEQRAPDRIVQLAPRERRLPRRSGQGKGRERGLDWRDGARWKARMVQRERRGETQATAREMKRVQRQVDVGEKEVTDA